CRTHSNEDVHVLVGLIEEFARRRRIHKHHVGDAASDNGETGLGDSRQNSHQAANEEAEFVVASSGSKQSPQRYWLDGDFLMVEIRSAEQDVCELFGDGKFMFVGWIVINVEVLSIV
ncbi:hypothetical protein PFISCL1PPCAC_4735, partial [Pristionchus fissidentatus]